MASKGANIAARCHSHNVIKMITESLDESNMLLFRNGPFGDFLNLQHAHHNYQCQLFYHFMKLRNVSGGRKSMLVFDFKNSELVFGPRDYYLMSGLAFGPFQECPTTSTLWETHLHSTTTLTMSGIVEAFKSAVESSVDKAGGGDTCLKLAHVLFIYGVLFPRDTETKKLDIEYLHVCDDMERVKQFPWGLYSYKYFVEEFDKACGRMITLVRKGKPNIEIFGFLFVFQFWLYEILPGIAMDCGETVENWEHIYPRVLRWKTASGQRTFKRLKFVLDKANIVQHPLITSIEEEVGLSANEQYFECDYLLEMDRADEHEHKDEEDGEHEQYDYCEPEGEHEGLHEEGKVEAPIPQMKSAKRKLNLESGDCSMKPETKRRPGLRSDNVQVDAGVSDHSFPSVSTPDAKEKRILQLLSSRMEKLEECCSQMNKKWDSVNVQLEDMGEKLGILLECFQALSRTENKVRASCPHDDGVDGKTVNQTDKSSEGNKVSEGMKVNDAMEMDDGMKMNDSIKMSEVKVKNDASVLVLDDDMFITVPVSECTSNNPCDVEDLRNAFAGDYCDNLNEVCLDENAQIRMVHEDDSVTRWFDDEPGYSRKHFEENFLEGGARKGTGFGDGLDDDFVEQLDDDMENPPCGNVVGVCKNDAACLVNDEATPHNSDVHSPHSDASDVENYMHTLDDLVGNLSSDILHIDNLVKAAAEGEKMKKPRDALKAEGDEQLKPCQEVIIKDIGKVEGPVREDEMRRRPSTRSNPVLLSSSSDGSASLNASRRRPKRQLVRSVGTRFADAAEEGDTVKGKFDPLKKYSEDFIEPFTTWYKNPPKSERSFKLRSHCPLKVGVWFFEKLTVKDAWLSTQNCDAILNLLLFKANSKPNLFLKQWTVAEHWVWRYLHESDLTPGNKKFMLRYSSGELPEIHGKPWRDVDHVYGIGRVFGNHFVAYDLRIPQQEIVVYDSMSGTPARWKAVKDEFELMSQRIPWMCSEAGVSHYIGPAKDVWDVIENTDTPQQSNGHDCGIYAIKCIECLVSGWPVSYLGSDLFSVDAGDYYCAEFFNSRVKS